MKKIFILFSFIAVTASSAFAQLSDEEYSYVTMDLQGILNLSMTTDPNVGFSFKTIADYKQGITKFNATKLDVDATVAWDLFTYASTPTWTQVESYSTNGTAALPAEILLVEVNRLNTVAAPAKFSNTAFTSLKGLANSGVTGGVPTIATQYLAGMFGQGVTSSYAPGSAQGKPLTNQFRLHYKLKPGIPASFSDSSVALGAPGYAQAGYYYLEVVYALIEDL